MTSTIFLRLPAVISRTGLSRSSIYAFIAQGKFPQQIAIGKRAVGWDSDSIDRWIEDRIKESCKGGKKS